MKIAFAASEVFPFAKTGGLADVAGSLPKALNELGHDIKVFVPRYALIDHSKYDLTYSYPIGEMPIRVNNRVHNVHVFTANLPGSSVEVYFIDCPHFFKRENLYTNDSDEDERFILFSKAVIESVQRLRWVPDIIHCNDWQTGLIPLYIKDNYSWDTEHFAGTATVMTIHNIAYQGRFSKETLRKAEIREELFYENSPIEVWGAVCFLKTGLMFADYINTVSYTYAKEISSSGAGVGLEGVLQYRSKEFTGIINGVDYTVWNPETDRHLPHKYRIGDLSGKEKNKQFLLDAVRLPYRQGVPLIGIVSRLVNLKGFDLVAEAINGLMHLDAQWVILGTGEEKYENLFRSMAYAFPQKVFAYIGYNNELSHLIEAGADMFLMPSYTEPCGLNQIYSLKYGTVPIVRKTGGLADTVRDWDEMWYQGDINGTGFSFFDYTSEALFSTVKRALRRYPDKNVWNAIVRNAMMENYSWKNSAEQYVQMYTRALMRRRA